MNYSQSAFYSLGKNYADDGNYTDAIRVTKKCLDFDISNPDKYNLLLDYISLCEYYSYTTENDSCQVYSKKALDLYPTILGIERSQILQIVSHHLLRAGFSNQAIEYRKELVDSIKKNCGKYSSRLIGEYRILSSFCQQANNHQMAIEYAKNEELIAFQNKDITNEDTKKITYDDSFDYLIYAIQVNEKPIDGIKYLLERFAVNSGFIADEVKLNLYNAIWATIVQNNLLDDVIGITAQFDGNLPLLSSELSESIISASVSTADEFIQRRAWELYDSKHYDRAKYVASKVLALKERLYGLHSDEYLQWLGMMSYQALISYKLEDMSYCCHRQLELIEKFHGIDSDQYKSLIADIRGYAHQLVDKMPKFTTNWIEPYYQSIKDYNILPQYQYEFEILQNEGFLVMDDLKNADRYANELTKWTYKHNDFQISLEDEVRIGLKLAKHYLFMGDHIKSRIFIENSWKRLQEEHSDPSMAQLIDRHIVERQLRMDTLGRSRMNAEWIIETATPIIEDGIEDDGTIAFFYDSRAWAYEEIEQFDNAIADIKQAYILNPLYSRKKKLGQFYLHKKEYELAESVFLELYNDSDIPEVGIKSIEADLTSLYWLWGKLDKLGVFMSKDYENLKSEVKNAFAFMNEDEREKYLDKSLLGSTIKFDTYTSYSNDKNQWQYGNEIAYNLALAQKGLLLSTTRDIDAILQNAPDSIQTKFREYEEFRNLLGSPGFSESGILREKRLDLMQYVANHPQFLSQLNYTWEDVRNHLNDNEAAIEFINLWGVTPNNMKDATPSLGALVLRKDSKFPAFVKLACDSTIIALFEFDEEGERLNELLYSDDIRKQLYSLIWEPLLPYLSGIQSVFYSPTGIVQDINLDWIGNDDTCVLCNKYNMYRLSSTRELCNNKQTLHLDNAVLYGDIAYSMNAPLVSESNKSKYRSTTRAGFTPLKATAIELDSINSVLSLRQISSKNRRKNIATEASFREMSGNSPDIIHVATHGFYYSKDAIEKEYQYGNFIAFQGIHPELYHSGLALTGAQDTWYNEDGNISKYLDLDPCNDGILLSSEIANFDLRGTDLVVLSACETALGEVKSEGVYGLQRAFKLAGVNSLIMSLWKVDDDATQLLMTSFYQNYLAGMSKREALITAQNNVKNTPGFEDPYNWAAFILLDGLY